MKKFINFLALCTCSISLVFALPAFAYGECTANVTFLTEAKSRTQLLKLAEGVSLRLEQSVASQHKDGAKIASNVICQLLSGANYTGSREEWQNFIDSANRTMLQKKYENVTLTMVGDSEKVYKGNLDSKEYIYIAKTPIGTQHIYNLAVLDIDNNAMHTLSVSGDESVSDAVAKEFQRLVGSFKLKSTAE